MAKSTETKTTKAEVFDRVIQNDEGQRYLALESTILLKEDVLLLWVINKGLNSATLNFRPAIELESKESTSMIMFFAILDFSLPRRLDLSSCDANSRQRFQKPPFSPSKLKAMHIPNDAKCLRFQIKRKRVSVDWA